jgi:hypothetical protein
MVSGPTLGRAWETVLSECARGKPMPSTAADTVVFTGHLGDDLYGSIAKAPHRATIKLASKFGRGGT